MPPCSLGITVRNTSDICIRTHRLHFGAALRIVDHHLHVSGILPSALANSTGRIYDHEWFCVSQSITTPTSPNLWKMALQQQHPDPTIGSSSSSDNAQIHTWVSKIGKSSLQLASSVHDATDNNQCLALAKRVFVRRSPPDDTGQPNAAAPFSNQESKHFERFMYDNNMQILPDLSELKSSEYLDPAAVLVGKTENNKEPKTNQATERRNEFQNPVLFMPIGPQHINVSHHVDHAFLAETAAHALWKTGYLPDEYDESKQQPKSDSQQLDTLRIQYVAEPKLGSVLECHVDNTNGVACLYQQQQNNNPSDLKQQLVAIAESGNTKDKQLHSRHY